MKTLLTPGEIRRFRQKIWRFYRDNKRSFPFRKTSDPYCITVSEVMLQQTQAERVADYYTKWIRRWPNWRSLSKARKQELLRHWSGLGYNRRALWLGQMSKIVSERYSGQLPRDPDTLMTFTGIGEYTSRAILIFAHNEQLATVDTNIRHALISELSLDSKISQRDLFGLAEQLTPRGKSREWHYALMDYARLALSSRTRRAVPKPRQSTFEGSLRQIRGEIVRRLTGQKSVGLPAVGRTLKRNRVDTTRAARSLERDGVVRVRGDRVYLVE